MEREPKFVAVEVVPQVCGGVGLNLKLMNTQAEAQAIQINLLTFPSDCSND